MVRSQTCSDAPFRSWSLRTPFAQQVADVLDAARPGGATAANPVLDLLRLPLLLSIYVLSDATGAATGELLRQLHRPPSPQTPAQRRIYGSVGGSGAAWHVPRRSRLWSSSLQSTGRVPTSGNYGADTTTSAPEHYRRSEWPSAAYPRQLSGAGWPRRGVMANPIYRPRYLTNWPPGKAIVWRCSRARDPEKRTS